MIYEFAVDPVSISNWSNFRAIVGNFGVEYGRLISRFPRRWEKEVYQACNVCQDVKLKAIEEALARIKPKLVSMSREYDDGKDWRQNAEDQHAKTPFRAIITRENPDGKGYVLVADYIFNGMGEPWDVKREQAIERTPKALGQCAALLLRISKEILFVDPHFDPQKKRFVDTFCTLIKLAFEYNRPGRVELHVEFVDDYETDVKERIREWRESCLNELPQHVPRGCQVRIVSWSRRDGGEKFHARYILTERGGIRFDVGLDKGGKGETTDVMLLDHGLYNERWQQFQLGNDAFDLIDEFLVEGDSGS